MFRLFPFASAGRGRHEERAVASAASKMDEPEARKFQEPSWPGGVRERVAGYGVGNARTTVLACACMVALTTLAALPSPGGVAVIFTGPAGTFVKMM